MSMKRVIIWSIALQIVNALIVALCHKSIMALLFSMPVGVVMAWIIGDSLENRRITTRHHGVIERDMRPCLYWFLIGVETILWGITMYFPWGTTF